MARRHALELLLAPESDALVRRDWQAFRDAGLPSQLDHPGSTNAPHVTLLEADEMDAHARREAVRRIGPLLPLETRAAGLTVLGGASVTLARTLDVPDSLTGAVAGLRTAHGAARHPGWLPHVTLARRVPRGQVQRGVDALGYADEELWLVALRWWDPAAGAARVLAGRAEPRSHR